MADKTDWLKFERWAVWGAGRSGIAAANLLARAGKDVILSDSRQLDAGVVGLDERVRVIGGANHIGDAQVIVTSPGLKPSLPVFEQARQAGVPVISEIELAFAAAKAPFVCITGTDGKTTTTSLVGAILEHAGREVVVAGNIGVPLCEVVEGVSEDGVIVAEVSAFQLWTTHTLRPVVACITNLADDHLDYFDGDFDAYCEAKRAMTANMGAEELLVINAHDARAMAWGEGFAGRVGVFGLDADVVAGVVPRAAVTGGELWVEDVAGRVLIADDITTPGAFGLLGEHNHKNMACAALMCHALGVDAVTIGQALRSFQGLPHRFELAGVIDGVRFIDDSKATNAHAAVAGLRGLHEPFVSIVGGVDKGLELGELCELLAERSSGVVRIGALSQRLFDELGAAGLGVDKMPAARSMWRAVLDAVELARCAGASTVTLSPACSSFDMYDSYAHRGRVFQECLAVLESPTKQAIVEVLAIVSVVDRVLEEVEVVFVNELVAALLECDHTTARGVVQDAFDRLEGLASDEQARALLDEKLALFTDDWSRATVMLAVQILALINRDLHDTELALLERFAVAFEWSDEQVIASAARAGEVFMALSGRADVFDVGP